jgi:hypothetical protein
VARDRGSRVFFLYVEGGFFFFSMLKRDERGFFFFYKFIGVRVDLIN